jgi:hypothetical protein
VERQSNLSEIIRTLRTAPGLARGLHGGQQECDQNADNRDHDQQLDQGKTTPGGFASTPEFATRCRSAVRVLAFHWVFLPEYGRLPANCRDRPLVTTSVQRDVLETDVSLWVRKQTVPVSPAT